MTKDVLEGGDHSRLDLMNTTLAELLDSAEEVGAGKAILVLADDEGLPVLAFAVFCDRPMVNAAFLGGIAQTEELLDEVDGVESTAVKRFGNLT